MEKSAARVENLLEDTLFLYQEFQDVLEQEKIHIMDMDVASLWETIAHKRQMAIKLAALSQQMHHLLEQRAAELNMDGTTFKLSDLIKRLPVSPAVKSHLRKCQLALAATKKEAAITAMANKSYIDQYLGVINDIFALVVDMDNQNQYTAGGSYSESKEKKRLIQARI